MCVMVCAYVLGKPAPLTSTRLLAGSEVGLSFALPYAAPETVLAFTQGRSTVCAATCVDTFAFGIMCFELLARRPYYSKGLSGQQVGEMLAGLQPLPHERLSADTEEKLGALKQCAPNRPPLGARMPRSIETCWLAERNVFACHAGPSSICCIASPTCARASVICSSAAGRSRRDQLSCRMYNEQQDCNRRATITLPARCFTSSTGRLYELCERCWDGSHRSEERDAEMGTEDSCSGALSRWWLGSLWVLRNAQRCS